MAVNRNTPLKGMVAKSPTPLKGFLPKDPSPAKIPWVQMAAKAAKVAGKQQKAEIGYTMHASDRVMSGISGRQG